MPVLELKTFVLPFASFGFLPTDGRYGPSCGMMVVLMVLVALSLSCRFAACSKSLCVWVSVGIRFSPHSMRGIRS